MFTFQFFVTDIADWVHSAAGITMTIADVSDTQPQIAHNGAAIAQFPGSDPTIETRPDNSLGQPH